MRTDDAVGMLTLRELEECGRLPPEVRVIEGGTLGLDLLECLRDISHLLVLDAVDSGAIPGTLKRFEGPDLQDLPVSKSVHLLGFSDLIGALRLMDAAPEEVVLIGVQPASTEWGTALTPRLNPPGTPCSKPRSSNSRNGQLKRLRSLSAVDRHRAISKRRLIPAIRSATLIKLSSSVFSEKTLR